MVGLLMVSRFRYFSFKSCRWASASGCRSCGWLVAVLLLALLVLDPPRVLLVGFTLVSAVRAAVDGIGSWPRVGAARRNTA